MGRCRLWNHLVPTLEVPCELRRAAAARAAVVACTAPIGTRRGRCRLVLNAAVLHFFLQCPHFSPPQR
eukprot:NODE_28100_length_489_cov_4.118785.p3 GENE.NODE_28100_length_489_cov_4.118785~~NODE_28100_length_489_cov_4.118785.p3  ORF type:complete len:68 (+),score=4.04 NODE_28100_length_489_cov_4.118785:261-464(+)